MLNNKKILVVLPAFNAESTLEATYNDIPFDIVDEVLLVDDGSKDATLTVAKQLGVDHIISHEENRGYGANQKTCYNSALGRKADIIIMLHPDYQYTPKLIYAMSSIIAYDIYPVIFGSRILGKGALKGGMPLYKFVANRFLTFFQNLIMDHKLSEYHTGYRAFSQEVLRSIDFNSNSNDFIFDNEIVSQIIMKGYEIGEVTCPTVYSEKSSSINFPRSVKYGLGVLVVSIKFRLHKWKLIKSKMYL